ncbi:MAG TPA: hypothetical protein VI895_11845 [Bdellovibrionota bacterium]|nr:hypothetical protein [Bdellovibrionota bacterium]
MFGRRKREAVLFLAGMGSLLGLLVQCGGGGLSSSSSEIEFAPNPALASSGTCSSEARMVALSGSSVTLVSLWAMFVDPQGHSAQYTLDANQLGSLIGSVELPGHSTVVAPLSFDLAGQGLTVPADGTVVVIGVGSAGATHFVGSLRCES